MLEVLAQKSARSCEYALNVLRANKNYGIPETIEELKEFAFSPKLCIGRIEVYLLDKAVVAARKICDLIYEIENFNSCLTYDDIFKCLIKEVEFEFEQEEKRSPKEFFAALKVSIDAKVQKITRITKVEGFEFTDKSPIEVAGRRIVTYSSEMIDHLDFSKSMPREDLEKEFRSKVVIIGEELGSKSKAEEKFYKTSEFILSLIRLYAVACQEKFIHRINIRLINSAYGETSFANGISWSANDLKPIYSRRGAYHQPLYVGKDDFESFRRDWYFGLAESLIDKKEKTQLEELISRSIFWFGDAQKDSALTMKFVKLWTCVECFFSIGGDELTENNAKGIASLLVFGGFRIKPPSDYSRLKARLKKLYAFRSRAVHSAITEHIGLVALEEFATYVSWVILTMLSLVDRGYSRVEEVLEQTNRLDGVALSEASS